MRGVRQKEEVQPGEGCGSERGGASRPGACVREGRAR